MIDIDHILCDGCGACVDICPTNAILLSAGKASIKQAFCKECRVCMNACPQGAIQAVEQIRVIENKSAKPYSAPASDAITTDQPSVISSLLGAVINSGLALGTSAERNQPVQRTGRGQGGGRRQGGGRGRGNGRGQGGRGRRNNGRR